MTVQGHVGARRAGRVKAQVMQQIGAVAILARHGHEAGGDQLIRVDIVLRQRHGGTVDEAEPGHQTRPSRRGRTSVMVPVTAAAATMAGLIRWVRAPRP